jgi:integrase
MAWAERQGGQRITQLLRAKWPDYDEAAGTLLLRDPKGRGGIRDHLVPVSEWGSTLLAELRTIHTGSGFVFEATNGKALGLDAVSAQFAEVARSVSASSKATGEGFQLRDLRRTVETRLASLRVDKETRAQLLDARATALARPYVRRAGAALRPLALPRPEARSDCGMGSAPTRRD